jgi:hypothetical protein
MPRRNFRRTQGLIGRDYPTIRLSGLAVGSGIEPLPVLPGTSFQLVATNQHSPSYYDFNSANYKSPKDLLVTALSPHLSSAALSYTSAASSGVEILYLIIVAHIDMCYKINFKVS